MISRFKPIVFLETNPRIRSLFDSFWGLSQVENPLVHYASEADFWNSSEERGLLLLVDARIISDSFVEWLKRIHSQKPWYEGRVICVVETKEERDRMIALGVIHVLRLPFQWGQWLPVMKKMGLQWKLWTPTNVS